MRVFSGPEKPCGEILKEVGIEPSPLCFFLTGYKEQGIPQQL
jgi:hypothetical protein